MSRKRESRTSRTPCWRELNSNSRATSRTVSKPCTSVKKNSPKDPVCQLATLISPRRLARLCIYKSRTVSSNLLRSARESAGCGILRNRARQTFRREQLGRDPQLRSTRAAKSAKRSRLTRYRPPKDLTRKVTRRPSVIQALATRLRVAQT